MDEKALSQLLIRLEHDDSAAMQELFEMTRVPLSRFAQRLCRRTDLREDLVQAAYLKLWQYRGRYNGAGSARSYVFRVVVNEWNAAHARAARRELMQERMESLAREPEAVSPIRDLESTEIGERIARAIKALPAAQREVFMLHRIEGLACREIADVLDCSPKTVESRLRLAIEKLAAKLSAKEEKKS